MNIIFVWAKIEMYLAKISKILRLKSVVSIPLVLTLSRVREDFVLANRWLQSLGQSMLLAWGLQAVQYLVQSVTNTGTRFSARARSGAVYNDIIIFFRDRRKIETKIKYHAACASDCIIDVTRNSPAPCVAQYRFRMAVSLKSFLCV